MDTLIWNLVYGGLTLFSGMAVLGLETYLLHDWKNPGARHLFFLLASSGAWSIGYGLELLIPDFNLKIWLVKFEYIGVAFVGLALFLFVLFMTGQYRALPRKVKQVLWAIPFGIIFLAFTNDLHHLMWRDAWLLKEAGIQVIRYQRGPIFWVYVTYSYGLIVIASAMLVKSVATSKGPFRMQAIVMLPGIVLPWIANGFYLTGLPGSSWVDLGPLSLIVTCFVFALALFRYHLLHLIPLAHEAVMDGLGDPVIVMDLDDHVVELNQACVDLFGLGQFSGNRSHARLLFPELFEIICRHRDIAPKELQTTLEFAPKTDRDWHIRISPLYQKRLRKIGWLVVLRDVTSQNRAEQTLRQMRNYVKDIINALPSMIVGVDRTERITQWNRRAAGITGISEEEASGRLLATILPQLVPYLPDVEAVIETNAPRHWERQTLTLNDSEIIADIQIFPILSDVTPGAVIRVDDIGERVKIQEMMVQSEKMMSVGGLAAGMAHEINNPLSGMLQNIQVIRNRLTKPQPANIAAAQQLGIDLSLLTAYMEKRNIFYMMDQAAADGARAAQIVDNMLSFSRKQDQHKAAHALPRIMDATIDLLKNDYNLKRQFDFKDIKLDIQGGEGLPNVSCEKSKIQQVFFNILKNGTEAMAVSRTKLPQFSIRYFHDRDSVGVSIRDNGPGISKEVQNRIFEPFFTTKPVGMGTGLGLSVSYFIIRENHGGNLSVTSEPGLGTCFTVTLPLADSGE